MILFIGDTPSKRTDPNKAFKGAACESRLKEWIAAVKRPHEGYQLVNQSDYDKFLQFVMWAQDDGHPIVALGKNASKALGDIPHFRLPHPSARIARSMTRSSSR